MKKAKHYHYWVVSDNNLVCGICGWVQLRMVFNEDNNVGEKFTIPKLEELDGKSEESTGNRTRETGSRESEGSGAILNQAADERGVEGLSQ